MISSHLLFFFSALGAANGVLLALYFFTRRSHMLANRLLGALLLAISIRTGKSAFYFFNPDLAVEFLQFGLSACLLIGPLTYLYVRCKVLEVAADPVRNRWRRHIGATVVLIAFGLVFPYSRYPDSWYYFVCGIHVFWAMYLLAAGKDLWQARSRLFKAGEITSRQTILLLSVYFSSAVILMAYVLMPLTSYIVGALSFTFSIHVTVLSCLLQREEHKKEKYQNRKLAEQDALKLMQALNQLMNEQKVYLNPGLNLATLAKKAGALQTTVSQVINENMGKSFNGYVNEFRIQYAQNLLTAESHLNMEIVAERSGFNSSSTFFVAFKKFAGQTPANYRAARMAGEVEKLS